MHQCTKCVGRLPHAAYTAALHCTVPRHGTCVPCAALPWACRPGENGDPSQQTRTSTGTFLSSGQDPDGVLSWVEERISAATLLPAQNGEVRGWLAQRRRLRRHAHVWLHAEEGGWGAGDEAKHRRGRGHDGLVAA